MHMIKFTPRFWFALIAFGLLVVFGVLGPLIFAGRSPNDVVGGLFEPPSASAWLGSDNEGHSVFTRLMYGTRSSLLIGLIAGGAATVIGTILGLVAGYYGGVLEEGLMGITNVMLAIPAIVVLILLSVALDTRSIVALALVIGLTSWPWTARAVRAQTSSVRTREHLDVARLSGANTWSVLGWDILPFLLSYIWMAFVLHVAGAILAEAALAMLGLGPSDAVSLGNMLHWALAFEALRTGAWWAFIPPTIFLTLIAFTLLMLQSSLDEVFNPRLRRGGVSRSKATVPAAGGPSSTESSTAQEESGAQS